MKNSNARSLVLAGLCLAASPVFAQQAKPTQDAKPSAELLKKHVTYLASMSSRAAAPAQMVGNKAAQYIAQQFRELKLGCATPDLKCVHTQGRSGYFQELPFVASVELARNNSLSIVAGHAPKDLAVKDVWMPIGYSANGSVANAPSSLSGMALLLLN
jgi:hypothetical protein